MASKQSMKYGVMAVALALAIVAVATVAYPYLSSTSGPTTSKSTTGSATGQPTGNFLVLLTDPPTVPAGTTQLNVTYNSISIQVKYTNGSSVSVPVTASGTVNLLSLVNVSQTIGSTNIPTGSTVNSIQFTISSASATVNGQTYPVTMLSSQLVVPIRNGQVLDQTRSAALLDLSPTLVEVDATNSTGGAVTYYVLVPSATAIVKSNVNQGQENVGTTSQLDQNDKNDLKNAQQTGMANVTITSATLHTAGNATTFSVTLKNQGNANATIFGLTLHGNFSSSATPPNTCTQTTSSTSTTSTTSKSSTSTTSTSSTTSTTTSSSSSHGNEGNPPGKSSSTTANGQGEGQGQGQGHEGCTQGNIAHDHPDTIPFKVNATTLVPLFGDGSDHSGSSAVTLKAGQSITLTFTGVIGVKTDNSQHGQNQIIGAISGNSYTLRLDGEGFQTAQVTAT
jgi:Domain of unknown function (DUF4382)